MKSMILTLLLMAFFTLAAAPAFSQEQVSNDAKMTEILKTQQLIIQQLQEIKQELAIIKVRATR
jgi:hypothetical protein